MQNSERPFIFITNDDGIQAKGIHVLIEEMSKIGDVLVIAPNTGRSGMAHAITFSTPVRLHKHKNEKGYQVYDMTGTPVDCVKMALDKFFERKNPDLLVSGINHGSNASICSIYSGTVAAAREGAINSIPSIAFSSLDFSPDADFEAFRPYIQIIAKHVIANKLQRNVFLNVNFPSHDTANIKGIQVCRQTKGIWVEEFDKRTDPHNQDYFWLTGHFDNYEPNAQDSDEWLLKQNFVTAVPLQVETTDMNSLASLNSLNTHAIIHNSTEQCHAKN